MVEGLLLIDKPAAITSHDAVDRVRRAIGLRKIGHSGTLDPMATGLLVMGVGRATRLLRFLGGLAKGYQGAGVLGVETSTLDGDGDVVRESRVDVTRNQLERGMSRFVGAIEQRPPMYSAVKVGGEKLYRLARKGADVEAPSRTVHVFEFSLRRFDTPRFEFRVRCSSGTYVRSLVADLGTSLGCGAHVSSLRRTSIGPFGVDEATPPHDPGPVLPLERAVEHLAAVTLDEEEARVASHGSCLGPAGIEGPYQALDPNGRLIGIYQDDGAKAVPQVILAPV
jgi:tRNA pseudouridine55 synthase